jgi:PilZ domain
MKGLISSEFPLKTPDENNRRSTRVPLDISIDVQGEAGPIKGVTAVVNLHGALIRTMRPLTIGTRIHVTAYLTGKTAPAKVVYVSADNPQTCGIQLEEPQNIWGISLAPDDWDDEKEMAAGT